MMMYAKTYILHIVFFLIEQHIQNFTLKKYFWFQNKFLISSVSSGIERIQIMEHVLQSSCKSSHFQQSYCEE